MQGDATDRDVIEGYRGERERPASLSLQRAKNVRDRLADGQLGAAIDASRIEVRDGGVSPEGAQVKIWLLPQGAANPATGTVSDNPGPVRPERGAPRRRRR